MPSKLIYPRLPGRLDLAAVRLNGAGLGNCLFTYFHAVILAQQSGRRLLAPAWRTVAIAEQLRSNGRTRRYGDILGPHPDEISGAAKYMLLARHWPWRANVALVPGEVPDLPRNSLTMFEAPAFTFEGLHEHRAALRKRLFEILTIPVPAPDWGRGDYAAIHIRLGDFEPPAEGEHVQDNRRIPMHWYVEIAHQLRRHAPQRPIHLFSDGDEHELAPILAVDGVSLRREDSDIGDLLAMAGSSLLVGSNSTFARWAAFLGDMPTLWRAGNLHEEKPTGRSTPIQILGRGSAVEIDTAILR